MTGGEAIMATLMAPFVRDVLHADALAYGAISSAQAVGGLAGGAQGAGYCLAGLALAIAGHTIKDASGVRREPVPIGIHS